MKNTVLAAAAALALAISIAPGFATERGGNNSQESSNASSNCASILGNRDGHSTADVRFCETQQH